MNSLRKIPPPKTEAELLERCARIEGLSFLHLSLNLGLSIPTQASCRKGWLGQAMELALGADAQNQSLPDFQDLGIELKTLPINKSGKPTESTFVTFISLLKIHEEVWQNSKCYAKLKRILWVPIEGDRDIPYTQRRIGHGFLWSPDAAQEAILAADWNYLTLQINTGHLESLDAKSGEYLQIRPKAANGKSLCYGFDSTGTKIKTLPRGFYLRAYFTAEIFSKSQAIK